MREIDSQYWMIGLAMPPEVCKTYYALRDPYFGGSRGAILRDRDESVRRLMNMDGGDYDIACADCGENVAALKKLGFAEYGMVEDYRDNNTVSLYRKTFWGNSYDDSIHIDVTTKRCITSYAAVFDGITLREYYNHFWKRSPVWGDADERTVRTTIKNAINTKLKEVGFDPAVGFLLDNI